MFRKRRLRRVLTGLLVSLALVAAVYFFNRYIVQRSGERRFDAIVAHLDATDPRWRYEEIDADRGQLPDAENSTLLVPKFTAALATPRFDLDPLLASDYASSVAPNHVLDDDTYEAIDDALENNAAALAIARKFGDLPKGLRRQTLAPNMIDTKFPDVQETRLICRLLDLEAERNSRDGHGGATLGFVRPMLNAGRSLDGEPSMICTLVRIACDRIVAIRVERILALATPRQQLAEIQAELFREAESDLFWYSVRGTRAEMNHLFTNLRAGVFSLGDLSKSTPSSPSPNDPGSRLSNWWYSAYLAADHAACLEWITKVYETRSLPEHQQRAQVKRLDRDLPPKEPGSVVTRLLTPAFNKIFDASLRARANLRCAVVGVAIERFRHANGRWPATLDEIPKDILPAIPLDPFDGKPLRYVNRDDGMTVYSIGMDEQDDGGNITVGKPTNEPGQDIGFRLYNPDQRNLPAVPRPVPFGPNREWEGAEGPDLEPGPAPRPVEGK